MFFTLISSIVSTIIGVVIVSWSVSLSTDAMFDHKVLTFGDIRGVVCLGALYVISNTIIVASISGFSLAGFFLGVVFSLLFTIPLLDLVIDVVFPDEN